MKDLDVFGGAPGKKIDVPSLFIAGSKDWAMYQSPGAVESYSNVCSDFRGTHVVEGAGHWVQQEQPESVAAAVIVFLQSSK
jgi:pimeloyl-ACP methyl ester carboxylesterase